MMFQTFTGILLSMHAKHFGNLQVHVSNTQWIMIVELHQFHNLYNAEMSSDDSNEGICCCDSSQDQPCASQASKLQGCGRKCDTQLRANASHCIQAYPCSFSSSTHWSTPSIYDSEKFVFVLSGFPDMVSAEIVHTNYMCKQVFSNG